MSEEAFVLVHSPVAGPRTWAAAAEVLAGQGHRVVVPSLRLTDEARPPYWRHLAEQVARAADGIDAVTLVAHSGAGPLLPAVGNLLVADVRRFIFADATVPARTGSTPVVPAQFLKPLRSMARDGRLPKWSQWWGEGAMAALLPDPAVRREVEDEMPSLPLAVFEEAVPVPPGWPASPCGYLQFSPPYESEAAEARSRRWPVTTLSGGHFHMLVDPQAVATAIVELASTSPA